MTSGTLSLYGREQKILEKVFNLQRSGTFQLMKFAAFTWMKPNIWTAIFHVILTELWESIFRFQIRHSPSLSITRINNNKSLSPHFTFHVILSFHFVFGSHYNSLAWHFNHRRNTEMTVLRHRIIWPWLVTCHVKSTCPYNIHSIGCLRLFYYYFFLLFSWQREVHGA